MSGTWAHQRVTRQWPCSVCGKPDWCRHLLRDGVHTYDICCRINSDRPAKGDGGGWLHAVGSTPLRIAAAKLATAEHPRLSAAELAVLDRKCQSALPTTRLFSLVDRLAISSAALLRLGIGWHADWSAFTFPMRDSDGRVIGIRTRHADGSKKCVTGSRLGLIVPADLTRDGRPDVLLVTEGESDAAAALDLGLPAIARPGCEACAGLVVDYVARVRPARIVLTADADGPGQRGAETLARQIAGAGFGCRVLTLPGAKDVRAWKLLPGSDCHAMAALIDAPADREVPA